MNAGTPFSLLLIAAGAVLVWGVQDNVNELNLPAIGVILMAVGAFGIVMSLMFWSTIFGTRGTASHTHEDVYVDERPRRRVNTRDSRIHEDDYDYDDATHRHA